MKNQAGDATDASITYDYHDLLGEQAVSGNSDFLAFFEGLDLARTRFWRRRYRSTVAFRLLGASHPVTSCPCRSSAPSISARIPAPAPLSRRRWPGFSRRGCCS